MFQAKTPEKPQGWPDFDNAASYQQAADWPAGAIRMQGFSDFNYGCVNVTDSVVCTMDSQWIAKYMQESLWRSDPLVVEARKRVSPFLISDIFNAPPVSSSQTAMRQAISQFPRGVVVPIHCPDVGATVAAFLTPMTDGELRAQMPKAMMELTLLGRNFPQSAIEFYKHGRSTNMAKSLSGRELEILTIAAAGKNSGEIGGSIGISNTTVNNHIGKILKKMNVSTQSQAIALALQIGQISRSN